MSNHNTKAVEEILSSFKLSTGTLKDYIESIQEHGAKTHITIGCQKAQLAEFTSVVQRAGVMLGSAYQITLTNAGPKRMGVKGVDKVIMVASGKGGVGKSTIAFNLAIALANSGKRVGLVDVDIYGPSLPSLTGITRKPVLEDNLMVPHQKYGLKLMSVGYLVEGTEALIWRGPMTTKMLYQLIRLTAWDLGDKPLDYLIIDTPPGTGDVHLSLAENYKIDGAIVVSTPQELAIADVTRAMTMFGKLEIPVLGVIENYSYIEMDGRKQYVFGGSGASSKLAKKFGTKLLAEVPISQELAGAKPVTYYKPEGELGRLFAGVCKDLEF